MIRALLRILCLLSAVTGPVLAQDATPKPEPVDLRVLVRTEAVRAGMPPELADAVATVESNYNTGAIGDVGEIGLMQILPSTARMLGFSGTNAELATPATNARYGVEYLSSAWRQADGDICTTVMKYRAGHGETRFSRKSVAYCLRVRQILAAQGYPVRGEVPVATFGSAEGAVASSGPRRGRKARSRIDWARYDKRIKEIEARLASTSTGIMR